MESDVARLPDELVESIMQDAGGVVDAAWSMVNIDVDIISVARSTLLDRGAIQKVEDGDLPRSIMAVDGGQAVKRLSDMDLMLIQAVGVEGIGCEDADKWGRNTPQYISWSAALPHGEINESLSRGIMTLSELIILASAKHEVCILDGSHLTSIIGIKRALDSKQETATTSYHNQIEKFLEKYNLNMWDIPEIIRSVFHKENIVASTKYNSSRIIYNTFLKGLDIAIDDKSLLSQILESGEYTTPQHLGQGDVEDELYSMARIDYRLKFPYIDKNEFEWLVNEAIAPIQTRDINNQQRESDIFFTYFKPFEGCPVYKIEIKRGVAENRHKLGKVLRGIKEQVIYPSMTEPYPQYVADAMAKSVSKGMFAMQEAIALSDKSNDQDKHLGLLMGYRT